MTQPTNDNDPDAVTLPAGHVRLVPLIGSINVDTGEFQRFDVVQLIPTPEAAFRGHEAT